MTRRILATVATAIALGAATTTPAHAGPPWLSIELPANPLDPSTRGAFLVVRTYHHDRSVAYPVEARAEGIVNGKRTSIPLVLERTAQEGAWALRQGWPGRGEWVLVITGMPGEGAVTALVSVSEGVVRNVRVPSKVVENGRWTVPAKVTQADVDAELRSLVALASR